MPPSIVWLCRRFEAVIRDEKTAPEVKVEAAVVQEAEVPPCLNNTDVPKMVLKNPAAQTQDTEPGVPVFAPPVSGGAACQDSIASDRVAKKNKGWYVTVNAPHKKNRCQCKGHCHSNCPARKTDVQCPNAVVKLPGVKLCAACKCMVPTCTNAARRPHGDANFPENIGYCKGHYPRKSMKH